jgi:hypothetical protein
VREVPVAGEVGEQRHRAPRVALGDGVGARADLGAELLGQVARLVDGDVA